LHYIVTSVTLRERYVTCAVIMTQLLTSNLSGVLFCSFHGKKRGTVVHKNCSYFKATLTRIQNGCCRNTFELVFTITRTRHGYPDPYQCESTFTNGVLRYSENLQSRNTSSVNKQLHGKLRHNRLPVKSPVPVIFLVTHIISKFSQNKYISLPQNNHRITGDG